MTSLKFKVGDKFTCNYGDPYWDNKVWTIKAITKRDSRNSADYIFTSNEGDDQELPYHVVDDYLHAKKVQTREIPWL